MGKHSIVRIHQVATAIGSDSKTAIRLARAYSVNARSASSRVSYQTAMDIINDN